MTQALTVAQQELREIAAEGQDAFLALGLEFLTEEDKRIRPSRLKIAHQTDDDIGPNGVKAGEFYNAKTNTVYGTVINFTFLHFTAKTRAEYVFPYEKDVPLLCGSDDGKMPREQSERRPLTVRQDGPCATCDRAQWEDADGTKRKKPFCSEQHNFMLNIDVGEGAWDKVLLMLQKTRVEAANILRELAQGVMYKRYLFATTKQEEGSSGKYYVPIFSFGPRLTPEQSVETLFLARASHAAYAAGEIYVGADEGEGEGGNGNGNPHGGPAGENPIDGGPIDFGEAPIDLSVEPKTATPSTHPPVPESPPANNIPF